MIKKIVRLSIFLWLTFSVLGQAFAAPEDKPFDFSSGLTWSLGRPNPDSFETPWLPITQLGFRTKLTAKFSSGTIMLKFPIRVNFNYDLDQIIAGKTMKLKVSAFPTAPNGLAFENIFGLHLGSQCEVGFVGLSGIPDIMPWFNVNYNLWDLTSQVPRVGELLAQLKDQIDINCVSVSGEALPLGSSKSYHDIRPVMDITGAMLNDDAVKASILTKLKSVIPGSAMTTIKNLVKYYKNVDDTGANEFIDGVLEKVLSQFSFKIIRDPSYTVDGEKLTVNLKYGFPARGGWSTYPVNLTSSTQIEEIDIGIPAFCNASDKLEIKVTGLTYEFRLKQKLAIKLTVPILGEVTLGETANKVIVYEQVSVDITDHVLSLDIIPATDAIVQYRINEGCTSATVFWASPNIPLKGTLKVYNAAGALLQTQTESGFSTSHGLTAMNLSNTTPYTFKLSCVDSSGNVYTVADLTATTKASGECTGGIERATENGATISAANVTATYNSLNFTWNTNVDAASVIFISESPDFKTNYSSIIRKTGGVSCNDFFKATGNYALNKGHGILVNNPCYDIKENTMYYYTIRSYAWRDNDTSNAGKLYASPGVVGSIMTPYNTEPASCRAKVYNASTNAVLPNIPVIVMRNNNPANSTVVLTGADGLTSWVGLDRGNSNLLSVKDLPCYNDAANSVIPGPGPIPNPILLGVAPKTSPNSSVFDSNGNAVSGATVRITEHPTYVTTTDNTGKYTFNNLSFNGICHIDVSKTGYLGVRIAAVVTPCGLFVAPQATLNREGGNLTIYVKANTNGVLTNVYNAAVTVKEGAETLGTVYTDYGSGAIFSHYFPDDNIHNLDLIVTPPVADRNLQSATGSATLSRNGQNTTTIVCQRDTRVPQIAGLRIKQLRARLLKAIFDTGEESLVSIDFKGPAGSIINIPWNTTYATHAEIDLPLGTIGPGVVQVKAIAKDRGGNQIDSGFVDFNLFGGAGWNFIANGITTNSTRLSWAGFPSSDSFGKYVLKVKNLTSQQETIEEITSVGTKFKQLTGLSAGTSYEATISAKASDGNDLADAQTITFSTRSLPPQIQQFLVTPKSVALSENVQVSATIVDADTKIKNIRLLELDKGKMKVLADQAYDDSSVNFIKTIKFIQAGNKKLILEAKDENKTPATQSEMVLVLDTAKPVIAFDRKAARAFLNSRFSPVVNVQNMDSLSGDIDGHISWGDGGSDDFDLGQGKKKAGVAVKPGNAKGARARGVRNNDLNHIYANSGSYTIIVTASVEDDANTITSDPIQRIIQVEIKPAVLELVASMVGNNPNLWKIDYKVIPGSLPIKSWGLDFGDTNVGAVVEEAVTRTEGALVQGRQTRGQSVLAEQLSGRPLSGKGEVNSSITHLFKVKGNYRVKFTIEDGSEKGSIIKELNINILRNLAPDIAERDLRTTQVGDILSQGTRAQLKEVGARGIVGAGENVGSRVIGVVSTAQSTVAQSGIGQSGVGQAAIGQVQGVRSQVAVVKKEPVDILFLELKPAREMMVGQSCDIEAILKNDSGVGIREVVVSFESEDGFKDRKVISLMAHAQERIKFSWTPRKEGRQRLTGMLECREDENIRNNSLSQLVEVNPPVNTGANELELLRKKKAEIGRSGIIEEDMER